MTKKIINDEDLINFFEKTQRQLGEDREILVNLYKDLKVQTNDSRDYLANGQNLGKYAELLSCHKDTGSWLVMRVDAR